MPGPPAPRTLFGARGGCSGMPLAYGTVTFTESVNVGMVPIGYV